MRPPCVIVIVLSSPYKLSNLLFNPINMLSILQAISNEWLFVYEKCEGKRYNSNEVEVQAQLERKECDWR